VFLTAANAWFRPDMYNPNVLLSQKLFHYLDQGRTLNDIIEGRTLNALLWS